MQAAQAAASMATTSPAAQGSSSSSSSMHSHVVPIFPTSSVTGAGVPWLHAFLGALQPAGARPVLGRSQQPHFQVKLAA